MSTAKPIGNIFSFKNEKEERREDGSKIELDSSVIYQGHHAIDPYVS